MRSESQPSASSRSTAATVSGGTRRARQTRRAQRRRRRPRDDGAGAAGRVTPSIAAGSVPFGQIVGGALDLLLAPAGPASIGRLRRRRCVGLVGDDLAARCGRLEVTAAGSRLGSRSQWLLDRRAGPLPQSPIRGRRGPGCCSSCGRVAASRAPPRRRRPSRRVGQDRCSTPRPSTRQLRRNVSSVHAGDALGDHQTHETVVAERSRTRIVRTS